MPLPNIFDPKVSQELTDRINLLNADSQPLWGSMSIGQMLAHCNVTYEMAFEDKHPQARGLKKWLLKKFVKPTVVNKTPYKPNSRTAPAFLITSQKSFDEEKERLLAYLKKTVELGESHFDQKESKSFGKLSISEWNNMFYKHLDHHLRQFGV